MSTRGGLWNDRQAAPWPHRITGSVIEDVPVFRLEGLPDFREKARFLLEKAEDARLSAEFEKIVRETPPEEVLSELRTATDLIRQRFGRHKKEVTTHLLDYKHLVDEKVIWPWFFNLLTGWIFFIVILFGGVVFFWPPFIAQAS